MANRVKQEFILEGLDCANCAAKIEKKVNEINGVETASLNFVTKTLTVHIFDNEAIEAISSQLKNIVKKLEPDVVVSKKADEDHEAGLEGGNNKKENFQK